MYNFEENKNSIIIDKKNNPRYESLNKPWQRFFTAGDPDQFVSNIIVDGDRSHLDMEIEDSSSKTILFGDMMVTFEMIFHKFKKGCFVQFRENGMQTFLPFSKINYTNNWSNNIEIDPKFGQNCNNFTKFKRMLEYINQGTKYQHFNCTFHRNMDEWYGNNGIFRFEYPLNEYDSGYPMLCDMFQSLFQSPNHKYLKIDFFLNKRDNPLKRKDGNEPYHHFFNGPVPIEAKYLDGKDKMLPILSMNSGPDYDDYKIPTWECWRFFEYTRCKKIFMEKKNKEYKTFPHPNEFQLDFNKKKPIAVFRGRSTGIGTFLKNNQRMFVCDITSHPDNIDVDNIPFIDAKITEFNKRPKKIENDNFVRTVDTKKYKYLLGESLSYVEQSEYKYILHIPGHSCAYRLTIEMFFNSVILYFPHPTSMWFYDMLEPWVHYIPMKNFDKKHILDTIKWCKNNNEKCEAIAKNARDFAIKFLNSEYAIQYLENLLCELQSKYNLQYINQKTIIEDKIIQKINDCTETFQSTIFDDMYEKYWIDDMYYFQSYLHYLNRKDILNNFLQSSCSQKKLIQKKKTFIDYHKYRGIEFICKHIQHEFKRDDLQQLLVGYTFINKLHFMFPDHFVYTLFHHIQPTETKIFLQYKPHKTLFDFIQSQKLSFDDILLLWLEVSCILYIAQNISGFIHGDLMTWNILIEELPDEQYIFFQELNIGFHRKYIPCIIDYGESHIVIDNISYYNNIPFTISKISDIVFFILKTIENYISVIHPDFSKIPPNLHYNQKKHILLHHHSIINKIYLILEYLLPTHNFRLEKKYIISNCSQETIQNINNDLWNIKNFCKKMSKYSKLLENIDNYADIHPKEFISFLLASKCICNKLIHTRVINSSQNYLPPIFIPNYNFFMKNKIIEKIILTHSNNIIHHDNISYFEYIVKKIIQNYQKLFENIQSTNTSNNYLNQIYFLYTSEYKNQIQNIIMAMNSNFNSKIYIHNPDFDIDLQLLSFQDELHSRWNDLHHRQLQSIYFTNDYDYHQNTSSQYKYIIDLVMMTTTFTSKNNSLFHYRTLQKK